MKILIRQAVFSGGVKIHSPGDVVEVAEPQKFIRRGWGGAYTPPKAESEKAEGKQGKEKAGK